MRSTSPTLRQVGEHGRGRLDAQLDRLAQELQARRSSAARRAAAAPRMSTWKPLQMPTTGTARGRELADRVHHRREPGDRAGAQVVAVREPAGDDDRVDALRSCRRRASSSSAVAAELLDRALHVELAVRAREQHDADAARVTRSTTSYASITGLASRRSHISSTCARARFGVGARRRRAGSSCRCAPARRSCSRAPGSARSTVAPAGSAMPGRCVTSTCAVERRHASMLPSRSHCAARHVSRRRRTSRRRLAPVTQLVRLDVLARACSRSRRPACAARAVRGPSRCASMKSRTYCLSNDGGDVPGLVLLARPVARRVGRHHLVDHDDLAVALAELELRVGEDQAAALARARAPRSYSRSERSRSCS